MPGLLSSTRLRVQASFPLANGCGSSYHNWTYLVGLWGLGFRVFRVVNQIGL